MAASPPQHGHMDLYDYYERGLKDGTYKIEVAQTVSAPGAAVAGPPQTFYVSGPRFSLDPGDLHAQFPPPGSTGQFGEVLPHVTFAKRLVPWERAVPLVDESVPWLALLVFEEGELEGERGSGDYAATMAVSELLLPDPAGAVRKPSLKDVTAAENGQSCRAIKLSSTLFAELLPSAAEAPLLAHVRCVAPGASAVIDAKDPGQYSVVVANRFPLRGNSTIGATAIVHLVSLEGFGDVLKGTTPTEKYVQVVSLASWTFSCLEDPAQTFIGLAANLVADAGVPRSADSLRLKLPGVEEPTPGADDFASQTQRRLAEGYVALGYHARTGEDAFAWFRGPLTPVVPAGIPTKQAPFASSAAAMAFDPRTGLFDHSLAAAWQAGRSLALADEAFATALMRVRVAANASLEDQLSTRADVHTELAQTLATGVIQKVATASADSTLPPAPARAADPVHPTEAIRAALADCAVTLDPADSDVAAVASWLGRLELLYPVPFVHLVPDARMLPAESIRFFYVDSGWIGAMVDGALSIGVGTSRELAVQGCITEQLEALAAQQARAYRATQLDEQAPPAPTGPTAGLLMRSAMAAGWPGLTVTGTATDASGTAVEVPLLRLDHLAPTVLLCLFNGVPDTVTLGEPHEGLEFGVDTSGQIVLRQLTDPVGSQVGTLTIYEHGAPPTTLRPGGRRVLNIDTGGSDLLETIADAPPHLSRAALGPAGFALQMMKVPETLSFTATSGS